MLTAKDYLPFARGQQVMVQLRGNMCMCRGGPDGIELASSRVPVGNWLLQLAQRWVEEHGTEPTEEELAQIVRDNPPPMEPVMRPVLFCTLEIRGELLVAKYDTQRVGRDGQFSAELATCEVTLEPSDIKHVTVLVDSLIK